ncbi:MAG: hypothetical protein WCD35_17845 [Mycobacteriales bacterium]
MTTRFTPLVTYVLRRLLMFTPLVEQNARALVHERQLQAEADLRAARLVRVRRWQRRADKANLQVRLARLAVR